MRGDISDLPSFFSVKLILSGMSSRVPSVGDPSTGLAFGVAPKSLDRFTAFAEVYLVSIKW